MGIWEKRNSGITRVAQEAKEMKAEGWNLEDAYIYIYFMVYLIF